MDTDLCLLNLRSPVLDLRMRQLLRFLGSFQLVLQALLRCSAGSHSLCACRRRSSMRIACSDRCEIADRAAGRGG